MLPIPMFFQVVPVAAASPGIGAAIMTVAQLFAVGIVIAAIILLLRRRQGGPTSGRSTGNPRLRVAGGVLIAVGLGWLILALQMDVSVSSCDTNVSGIGDFGDRMDAFARGAECLLGEYQGSRPQVINIGLLSEKSNSLLLAGLTVLAGVILLAVSFNRGRTNSEAPKPIEGRGLTAAANAWRETRASLDESEYADFLTAFVGSSESMQAARHKRELESWRALDKSDTGAIEAFLAGDVFLALRNRVRAFIESEAGGSPELSALLSKLRAAEAEEKLLADQAAQKLEEERIQAEELKSATARKAAAAKAAGTRATLIVLGSVVAVVLVLGAAGYAAFTYVEAAKRAECKRLTQALAEKKAEFQRLNAPFKKQLSSMEEELASLKAKRTRELAPLARDLQSQATNAVSITFSRGAFFVDIKLVNNSEYCVMPLSTGTMVDIEFYRGKISVGSTMDMHTGGEGCLPPNSTKVFDVGTPPFSGTIDRVEIARAREFVDPRTREPVDWAEIAGQKTPDLDASRRAELEEKISAEKANPSPAEAAKQVAEANDALSSCPAGSAQ